MPPRLRWFFSGLTLVLLLMPGVTLYRELTRRPDIWWTPLDMAATLAESQDRVEIYAQGKPLTARLAAQELLIRDGVGSRPLSADEIRLRFNNWDRVRSAHLLLLLVCAASFGAGLVVLLLISTGRLAYRGEREQAAA